MSKNKNNQSKKPSLLYIIAGILVVVVVATLFVKNGNTTKESANNEVNAVKAENTPIPATPSAACFINILLFGISVSVWLWL